MICLNCVVGRYFVQCKKRYILEKVTTPVVLQNNPELQAMQVVAPANAKSETE